MREKIKLNPGEELKFERSRSKGSMGQTDIDYYIVVNELGEEVGTVVYEDHTSLKGLKRVQKVIQRDNDGKIIVQESW